MIFVWLVLTPQGQNISFFISVFYIIFFENWYKPGSVSKKISIPEKSSWLLQSFL